MCPMRQCRIRPLSKALDSHETPTQVSHLAALPPHPRCNEEVRLLLARSLWHLSISTFLQTRGLEEDLNGRQFRLHLLSYKH